jgi:hypothetical protein
MRKGGRIKILSQLIINATGERASGMLVVSWTLELIDRLNQLQPKWCSTISSIEAKLNFCIIINRGFGCAVLIVIEFQQRIRVIDYY